MYCKKCGSDMGEGKYCSNCGYSEEAEKTTGQNVQKKTKRKGCGIVVAILGAVVLLFALILILPTPGENTSKPSYFEEKTTIPKAPVLYTEYDISELFDDLENNAMNAKKRFQDKTVKISGYIETIDASGSYFSIKETTDYTGSFYSVYVYFKNDEQKEVFSDYSKGDLITVKGKITTVGEVLGYGLDLADIVR